ncbi:MFS general substrate transporter [Polychaeton citri CBS 116435]|uniref:MFS general substrate transporter n=1 Tax=Polychaeton citri CBS 116435 TaxID=1314669 RepID=A0A9P4QGC2_9PEZI|nr:MFS general substrate transporter [Polychaeton citri CBS 116435]
MDSRRSSCTSKGDFGKEDAKPQHPGVLERVASSTCESPSDIARTIAPADEEDVELGKAPPVESSTLEQDQQDQQSEDDMYSVFTTWQKRWIILTGSLAGWFSPMTGSIYYPAIDSIAHDLGEPITTINLTVTTYLIFQGLAPMFVGGFSESAGRRPAYFACFIIYIASNIGLALQNNYVALLVLRMLQSAGSSGTIALSNGLVGDCVTSAQRGEYIAWASLGSILGPTISPIIGGLLSQFLGWHWIFWFLLILSAVVFVPLALFLPETCRKVVGNGSVPPPWWSANITDAARHRHRAARGVKANEEKLAECRKNTKLSFPNPMPTIMVLLDFETDLLLLCTGLSLSCFYAISTGVSEAFHNLYGFNDIEVSLMFLPIGAGSIVSAFTTGKLVDWNYRRLAKKHGFPVEKTRQTDLSDFPIEKARMQIALPNFVIAAATIIGYGWTLDHKISLAGPIILLLILGYTLVVGFQCLNVLMVDIYPGIPAAATAANNVVRCLLGAAASAAIQPMVEAMGNGWAYTLLALLFLLSTTGPLASMKYGIQWRKAKKERVEKRRQTRSDKAAARAAAKP